MWIIEVAPGILAGRKTTPMDIVGAYVPGGRADYPSSVLMKYRTRQGGGRFPSGGLHSPRAGHVRESRHHCGGRFGGRGSSLQNGRALGRGQHGLRNAPGFPKWTRSWVPETNTLPPPRWRCSVSWISTLRPVPVRASSWRTIPPEPTGWPWTFSAKSNMTRTRPRC